MTLTGNYITPYEQFNLRTAFGTYCVRKFCIPELCPSPFSCGLTWCLTFTDLTPFTRALERVKTVTKSADRVRTCTFPPFKRDPSFSCVHQVTYYPSRPPRLRPSGVCLHFFDGFSDDAVKVINLVCEEFPKI